VISSRIVRGGRLGCLAGAAILLAACAGHGNYAHPGLVPVGKWTIEQNIDPITNAPVSNSILPTMRVANGNIPFPPPAKMQLMCFKQRPTVFVAFGFKIGSSRNAEVGYRFDDKPGHEPTVRIVDDYKSLIIEDPKEVAQFVNELATSDTLILRIRSLNASRTSAEFKVSGAAAAVAAAYANCPLKPVAGGNEMPEAERFAARH
jgi:hypothetical protein